MARGRGNAWSFGVAMICIFMIWQLHTIEAATYTVGDDDGWDFGVADWPTGKSFKAGDVLVFNYPNGVHDVVSVDAKGYNSCTAAPGSKTYSSGSDRITLVKGDNYFMCGFPSHCQAGMKISAHAA